MTNSRSIIPAAIVTILLAAMISSAEGQEAQTLNNGLFLIRHGGLFSAADPITKMIIDGTPFDAQEGKSVRFQNGGTETWTRKGANEEGWFKSDSLNNAYAYFEINSSTRKCALLESMGDNLVYVNGVPREGNKYGYKDTWESWEPPFNYSLLPISLKKGKNELLFVCTRGVLKAMLHDAEPGVMFNSKHTTVPDLLVGQKINNYAAVTVVNLTDRVLDDCYIRTADQDGISCETPMQVIQPLNIRKVRFKLVGPAPVSPGLRKITLQIFSRSRGSNMPLAQTQISVRVVSPTATHKITFISSIDGSVQYYVVVPPRGANHDNPSALFLSLHGADVLTENMANSYYPKNWGYIVCPTNGGPYGFDWEDWGRINAVQVLDLAESSLDIDPARVYLTGHSMGGHGTWIIGAQYPDRFGALGPSAGWISWWTYVFHNDTASSPIAKMLRRSTIPSNPFELAQNYKQLGVYVLQGSKDDNVPVSESINMTDTLKKFDHDFIFHEEMGAGHWWGLNDEAGTDCVDWPPMFDFFARHERPGVKRIEDIDFTTADPGISADDYWLAIDWQEKQLEPSRTIVRFVPSRNRFVGRTENVKMLSFDLSVVNKDSLLKVELDNTKLDSIKIPSGGDRIYLEKDSETWKVSRPFLPEDKNPTRYGTFKDAFRNNVIFVYGTHGTSDENKWAFDKARYDAEYFWYQGNGSIDIVSDDKFDPSADPDRNVILYGNESTNLAWDKVLDTGPVTIRNGKIQFGMKPMSGTDLACLMIRPRKGSKTASVGVVSGTGAIGMRLTYLVPYLEPGFGLPDLTIFNVGIFSEGLGGINVCGFFGLDWSTDGGDFVVQH